MADNMTPTASERRCGMIALLLCMLFVAACEQEPPQQSNYSGGNVTIYRNGETVECRSLYGRYELTFKPDKDGICRVPKLTVIR